MLKQIALVVLLGTTLFGCSQPEITEIDGFSQGTTYHLKFWSIQGGDDNALRQELNETLADVDTQLSTYRKDSIIEHINNNLTTDWQILPVQVIELLIIARDVYQESHGCYDPTVKPLFELWGFGNDVFHAPTPEQIADTKLKVGVDHVELDVAHHQARKKIPTLSVDLSSMGEGYTGWRLSRVLERHGIHNYLVEFGGDMLVKGHKPDGRKWRIAIERPLPNTMSVQKTVTIDDESGVSINTSGTYRHFFDANGKVYPHILDPRTSAPVTHDLVSATVFGNDPRISDAWATAMLCMGKTEGESVAEKNHLKVFFIQQQDQTLVESLSPALKQAKTVNLE